MFIDELVFNWCVQVYLQVVSKLSKFALYVSKNSFFKQKVYLLTFVPRDFEWDGVQTETMLAWHQGSFGEI